MHRGADGKVLFQVLEKRNAVTFRKKAATSTPEAVPDQAATV
jgi:hypothetical protein